MTRVHSRLNKSVQYQEHRTVDKEDEDGEYPVYELDIGDKSYAVIVGKPKYTYAKQFVIYFPIYAVQYGGIIRAQIGVFEVTPGHVTEVWKSHSGIQMKKLSSPVLYSFVNESFLEAAHCESDVFRKQRDADLSGNKKKSLSKQPKNKKTGPLVLPKEEEEEKEGEGEEEDEDEENRRFSLPNKQKKDSKTKQAQDVFPVDIDHVFDSVEPVPIKLPELPAEETEETAEKERKFYDTEIPSADKQHHSWLQKHMKNTAYRIVPMDTQNSFFRAIVEAYLQVGKKTSVQTLRRLLADRLTEDVFEEERQLYIQFSVALEELDRQIESLRNLIEGHKQTLKKSRNKDDTKFDRLKALTEEAQQWTRELADAEAQRKQTAALRTQYVGHMEHIQTLDAMREHIRSAAFDVNAWGIETLEYLLNMKTIVFSEEAFELGQTMGVLQCGSIAKELADKRHFEPEYYIMLAVSGSGSVYNLVTYHDHAIFRFKQIPFDVKTNILQKCMEKNAGPFYFIPDFENLKTKYRMDANDGHPDDYSLLPEFEKDKLFDPDVVFAIHEKGSLSRKPGDADNESMKRGSRLHEFAALAGIKGWRQMLDDSYGKVVLHIDGKRWKSVEHYVLGARYKKSHPEVYALFSLGGGAEGALTKDSSKDKDKGEEDTKEQQSSTMNVESISTDLKMARKYVRLNSSSSKPTPDGKPKKIKQKFIAVDATFDADKEREIALKAKFLDNLDLRHVLVSTKNALLLHGGKVGVPAQPDILLMRVRKEALSSSSH